MKDRYYFAYGSNMNLDQMEFRCPDAEVVGNVRLEGYRLAFAGRSPGNGVATILPEEGKHVDGVLWKITPHCEKSLDRYEGYPFLYGKEMVEVTNAAGIVSSAAVYTMNAPHKDFPARPSDFYLKGILEGCRQNQLPTEPVLEAVKHTRQESIQQKKTGRNRHENGSGR